MITKYLGSELCKRPPLKSDKEKKLLLTVGTITATVLSIIGIVSRDSKKNIKESINTTTAIIYVKNKDVKLVSNYVGVANITKFEDKTKVESTIVAPNLGVTKLKLNI